MCGLFGFFGSTPDSRPDLDLFKSTALSAGQRGPESFGVYARFPDSTFRIARHNVPLSTNVSLLDELAPTSLLIGHARLATSGTESSEAVQPIVCENGDAPVIVAHNGNVYNYHELAEEFWLDPQTNCDSEIIALLIAHYDPTHSDTAAVLHALFDLEVAPLALFVLAGNGFFAARRKLPLFSLERREGIYLCSVAFDPSCEALPDNSIFRIGEFGSPRSPMITIPFITSPTKDSSLPTDQPEKSAQRESSWQQLPLQTDQS